MTVFTEQSLAIALGNELAVRHWRCAAAESCTGGRLSAAITEIPGSSQWFDRAFITYTNQSKQEMLGVPLAVLMSYGAVSRETVLAMAHGVLANSQAEVAVAVSGIAGPGGGSDDKPVGLVWVAWAGQPIGLEAQSYYFKGDRTSIRAQAVCVAMEGLILRCRNKGGE